MGHGLRRVGRGDIGKGFRLSVLKSWGSGGVVGPGKVLISLSCVAKRKGCATTEEGFEAKN
jgi:hypothetical protein